MKIIEIEHDEYIKMYKDLEPLISLHSSWTDSENNSQETKWCLNNCSEWFLQFCTDEGVHSYYKQIN